MFLQELSKSEQQAFLGLALAMIDADNVRAPEEITMLSDILREMELPLDTAIPKSDIEELSRSIERPRARALTLLELASIGYVDGKYVERERSLLRELSTLWNVDPLSIVEIELWGENRTKLVRNAMEIIADFNRLRGANDDD